MPVSCSAHGCTSRFRKGSNVKFFRFPKDLERRKRWKQALRRTKLGAPKSLWEPSEHDRLCSQHFVEGKPSTDQEHPDYVPSVFIFTPVTKAPSQVSRYQRRVKRRLALTPIHDNASDDIRSLHVYGEREVADEREVAAEALLNLGQDIPRFTDAGTDPGPDVELQVEKNYKQLQSEYQRLRQENDRLADHIKRSKFTYTNLNDKQICSMTGVPSVAVFHWILERVTLHFQRIGGLSPGDQLLLVLMKLRLNLTNLDLAFRFKVLQSQVSKMLAVCIPVISKKLSLLITWPCKGTILKNMPSSFKHSYRKCRVIIDCAEIFLQRPSNLDARARTYSNYKHHNTLKFLVGITPYGAVSFLSKCWGGRASDKEITARSGFYDKLEHGDLVLADRGFLISEELAARGASLAIPPFTRGKKQLSQREVECARRLSRSRIHVERAIERIKNFHILKHTFPITLMKHADHILHICGALTNLLPKLVK